MNQSQQNRHDEVYRKLQFRGRLSPDDDYAIRDALDLLNSYLTRIYDLEQRVKEVNSLILPSQRFEAAKAAMQGILSKGTPGMVFAVGNVVVESIKQGDALIAALQEKDHDT